MNLLIIDEICRMLWPDKAKGIRRGDQAIIQQAHGWIRRIISAQKIMIETEITFERAHGPGRKWPIVRDKPDMCLRHGQVLKDVGCEIKLVTHEQRRRIG